jgi:hypothetical protein
MAKSKPVAKKKASHSARNAQSAKKKAPTAKKKTAQGKKPVVKAKKKTTQNKNQAGFNKEKFLEQERKKWEAEKNNPNTKDPLALIARHGTDAHKYLPSGAIDEYRVELLSLPKLAEIKEAIQTAMEDFQDLADNNLSTIQRRRKIGAGVRNYGFIEKVADLAEVNPQFAQFFDPNDLRNAIMNFDECRNIALLLQSFVRLVTNTMLIYSNEAFIMSSIFYSAVQTMSRRGDPVANALFNTLRPFFHRRRRTASEPTMKQAEHDVEGLLKGTKEGSILIENIAPKITGGSRKIVDNVRKGSLSVKDQENFKEKE